MILLSPFLLSIFIVEIIILTLFSISLYWAIKISLDFDLNNTSTYQYNLANSGYLVAIIITFTLSVKLGIFLYFIFSLDALSSIVPGAMCAAGILSGSDFGVFMLGLKIINLFLLSGWLLINHYDLKSPISKYMKLKFILFQPLFFLLVLEFILSLAHFSQISTQTPVACCSVIFSQNEINSLPFYQTKTFILSMFALSFILYSIFALLKKPIPFGILSIANSLIVIYAIIRFFSPYIYQLPTHLCPFCMLQKEYFYIGYPIYLLIFMTILSGWFALILFFLKKPAKNALFKLGLIANCILFALLISYPIIYYFSNGVFLN
ncbi:MAG: hypothetical protein CR967_03640 [Proteobacteria bacterium]|nr:MAG: hypothetical protein CR967_03640 [Pseudomonadota bacterium]